MGGDWTFHVLDSFDRYGSHGANPHASLIFDAAVRRLT
jgi:hypothetical protein